MKKPIYTLLAVILVSSVLAGCDQKPAENGQPVKAEPAAKQEKAPDYPRGRATLYGIFGERSRGRVVEGSDTSTGKVIRGMKVEFQEETTQIPLRKGVIFGYRYWLKLAPDQRRPEFKRVLIHPPMTLPDGSTVARSERMIRKKSIQGIVTSIDLYALSEDYELVEGDWTFQIWYGDKMLAEQRFTTFQPEEEAPADAENAEQATEAAASDT
jgi:hypothetical protein